MIDHLNTLPHTDATLEQNTENNLSAKIDPAPATALILQDAYRNAGTQPLTPEEIEILQAPVDAEFEVELHELDGPYVPWRMFHRRLNRAFKPGGWAPLRMVRPEFYDISPVMSGVSVKIALKVGDRILGDAYGEQKAAISKDAKTPKMTATSAIEGATKNAIKKICSSVLGMFEEVGDRRWREEWLRVHARKVRKDGFDRWERLEVPTQLPPQEGFVRKVNGPSDAGVWTLTIETDKGEVVVHTRSAVEFRTKLVPQKGGNPFLGLDYFSIKEDMR